MRRTPKLRIVPNARRWAIVSGLLLALAVGSLLGRGLELSLDFVGGSSFRVEGIGAEITPDLLRATVEAVGVAEAVAQVSGPGRSVLRSFAPSRWSPTGRLARAVREALVAVTGVADVQETFVGPTWGQRITTAVAPRPDRLPAGRDALHLGPTRSQDGCRRGRDDGARRACSRSGSTRSSASASRRRRSSPS
jgi:preprotein translocase subunit SecF